MEESHYHHHHHHSHHTNQGESNSAYRYAEAALRTTDQQQIVTQPPTAFLSVPRPNAQTSGGVQATSSFHSVSSIDSSAEMAKYFPDAQTPVSAPVRHQQESNSQQIQSAVTSTRTAASNSAGPYAPVPVPTAVQQQFSQPVRGPVIASQQQQVRTAAAPVLPSGILGYTSQVEGLSVSQAVVNDVIVDLQSKMINETQHQYYSDSATGNYFEPLSPIYIRAPNPTIILRSDLHRLRAQLTARPPGIARHPRGMNQFQVPSFPPPHQYVP